MGELPFVVSPESSDVWANQELFLLARDKGWHDFE
jgi:4-alpha-glucanotransferase